MTNNCSGSLPMKNLLEVKNLKKYFPVYRGIFKKQVSEVKAVDGVSFSVGEGEIVGLVGESGSGKTSIGHMVMRLTEPTHGEICFQGQDLLTLPKKKLRELRPQLQMVFQDPLASLNPRKTVFDNIAEAMLYHKVVSKKEAALEVKKILEKVGLNEDALYKYPHQFSGGQQQRISIGRALALKPKLIICDEAVSALDLSVRAQILNLLADLKQSEKLSYLFISHDLSVVSHLCDRILVLYKGRIVESAPKDLLFSRPKHPYTQMLLASIPKAHPRDQKILLPPRVDRKSCKGGCPFFQRCPAAKPLCETTLPPCKKEGKHVYECIH